MVRGAGGTRSWGRLGAAALAVGVLAGACSGDDAPPTATTDAPTTDGSASLADALVDRSFAGDDVTDDGTHVVLVDGTSLHLTFVDAGRLTGSGGCNTLSGSWSLDGATLVVGELSSTEMGCEPDLMAQDDLLASLLTGEPRLTLDGAALVLRQGARTVRLTDEAGNEPDRPLVGTRWEITNVIEGEGADATSVTWASGSPGSVLLADDGTYAIETDCVTYTGTWIERDEGRIVFSVGETDEQPCDDPDPTLIEAMDALLLQGAVATVDGSRLELRSGELALGLRPATG